MTASSETTSATRSAFVLPLRQRELLELVLDYQIETGRAVPALKFRAQHDADRDALDGLERLNLLKRSENLYRISGLALPCLGCEQSKSLLAHIEVLYAELRVHYRENQQDPISLNTLAQSTAMAIEIVRKAMGFLQDATLWFGGGSSDMTAVGAFVTCNERILDFRTFTDLVEEVMSWMPSGATAPFVAPELRHLLLMNEPRLTAVASTGINLGSAAAPVVNEPASSAEIVHAWQAARSCLLDFGFDDIKDIAGLAGLNLPKVGHLSSGPGGATRGQLMAAFDTQVGEFPEGRMARVVTTVIEEMLRRKEEVLDKLSEYLGRLGWSFVDGALVPLSILDTEDLQFLPRAAHKDLLKAAQRMRDGDASGAISAACGAVDAAASQVYLDHGLGDPAAASFQERCRRAVQAKGLLLKLEGQLEELGWTPKEVVPFKKNLEGALNQAAFVLQSMRSQMGDVHGTKPIARSLAFESLRWSELIIAALVDPDELTP